MLQAGDSAISRLLREPLGDTLGSPSRMKLVRNHGDAGGEHIGARPRHGDATHTSGWSRAEGEARVRRPIEFDEFGLALVGGRFELGRALGDGSFASVFEAHDVQLDRKVALKLFTRYERDELDAALHEARSMAKLRHPNVLTVHDIGDHRGTPFLALEYCQTDLRRWLDRGPHAPEKIIARFIEAGRGLAAAHAAGLVHHDFKPANVLLREDGSVAVGDFGLAEPLETDDGERSRDPRDEDEPAFAVGTLRYIAPERLLGQSGDARSDQFSFCVALWEALAGEHPFTGSSAHGRYESIVAGPCVVPKVARSLVRALERGLAANPDDRFPDMKSLLAALVVPNASVRRAKHLRPMASVAALALTFAMGLGLGPGLPEGEAQADSTSIRVKATEQALAQTRDMIFDGEFEDAQAAYEVTYRLLDAASISERRQLIPQLVMLGELFEKAKRIDLAVNVFDDAARVAERVGLDPAPYLARRDLMLSQMARLPSPG